MGVARGKGPVRVGGGLAGGKTSLLDRRLTSNRLLAEDWERIGEIELAKLRGRNSPSISASTLQPPSPPSGALQPDPGPALLNHDGGSSSRSSPETEPFPSFVDLLEDDQPVDLSEFAGPDAWIESQAGLAQPSSGPPGPGGSRDLSAAPGMELDFGSYLGGELDACPEFENGALMFAFPYPPAS